MPEALQILWYEVLMLILRGGYYHTVLLIEKMRPEFFKYFVPGPWSWTRGRRYHMQTYRTNSFFSSTNKNFKHLQTAQLNTDHFQELLLSCHRQAQRALLKPKK